MVKYLEWDSTFFGMRIGSVYLDAKFNSELPLSDELSEYDIIYVFSNAQLAWNVPLVDIKITYGKEALPTPLGSDVYEFDPLQHNYDELVKLVYLSGHDSRFLKDPSFGPYHFKRLYKRWIDKSIEDNNTHVLVFLVDQYIAGFLTVTYANDLSTIGLIAVDQDFQGRGIGSKLIQAAESFSNPNSILQVATQETNVNACKFYEGLGFKILKKEFIYHYAHNTFQ